MKKEYKVLPEKKNCFKCAYEMSFIPPGISKRVGKPYKGFWSCKCGHTEKANYT